MSAFPGWEGIAEAWLAWAWRAALVSAVVLVALLVLRPLTRRSLSAHTSSWLWLLPLVPLVTPPLLSTSWASPWPDAALKSLAERLPPGLRPSLPAETPGRGPKASEGASEGRAAPAASVTPALFEQPGTAGAGSEGLAHHPAAFSDRVRLVAVWWALAAACIAILLVRQRRVHALVTAALPPANAALERRFRQLARQAGVGPSVALRLSEAIPSPVTAGIVRPVVLVPPSLLDELEPAAIDWILLHELTHVRRHDVLVEACVRLVRALWIVHPAVWIAPALAARERELACDDAALARSVSGAGPRAARALLTVLERSRLAPALALGSVPFARPASLHHERIMNLLDDRRALAHGLSPLSAVALVIAALTFVPLAATSAEGVQPSGPSANQEEGLESETTALHETLAGALDYLVAHQAEDGRWRASTRTEDGVAGELDDVGVTAAVLLALVDVPAQIRVAGREDALRRGLAYLAASQDPDSGAFRAGASAALVVPSHAMALRAWIRAHQRAPAPVTDPSWRDVARAAIVFAQKSRNPYSGWRYSFPPIGDCDSVITGWMLLALAEAQAAGFELDEAMLDGGLMFLDEVRDPATGRVGYDAVGRPTSRLASKAAAFPGEAVELPTAIALCARLALGEDPVRAEGVLPGAALLASKPPLWSNGRGTIDSYYWAFGTQAIQPFGGVLAERWNAELRSALLKRADRDEAGHTYWEAIDAWHVPGNEVAMTAMCVQALEYLP